jgi:hypothetical protein
MGCTNKTITDSQWECILRQQAKMPLGDRIKQMNTIGSWMRFLSAQSIVIAMAGMACTNGCPKTEPDFSEAHFSA